MQCGIIYTHESVQKLLIAQLYANIFNAKHPSSHVYIEILLWILNYLKKVNVLFKDVSLKRYLTLYIPNVIIATEVSTKS